MLVFCTAWETKTAAVLGCCTAVVTGDMPFLLGLLQSGRCCRAVAASLQTSGHMPGSLRTHNVPHKGRGGMQGVLT